MFPAVASLVGKWAEDSQSEASEAVSLLCSSSGSYNFWEPKGAIEFVHTQNSSERSREKSGNNF